MSDFQDLDDVFGALGSPATPTELSGETGMVDLMASNHRASKGPTMFTSRRTRVAVLIAAGVIGFGGVAAAGPGGFDLLDSAPEVVDTSSTTSSTSTTSTSSTTSTTSVPETTSTTSIENETAGADVAVVYGEADDPDTSTAFNEAYCLEGNHGKTVSAVARGQAPFEDVEVRDAAQSSCGKDDNEAIDDDSSDDSIDDDADEVEAGDDDSVDAPEQGHDDDHGQENSGKGNGKGGENQPAENRGGGNGKSGDDD